MLFGAGIKLLDLRGVWDRNVLDLTDTEVAQINDRLSERGMHVSCVATPVGKAPVDGDFEQQRAALARGIEIAQSLGTANVRIFSYYIPDGDDPARHRDEVIRRLTALVEQARRLVSRFSTRTNAASTATHHNAATTCTPRLTRRSFRALWDPGNFASCGYRPYHDSWELLHPYIGYVHVKDYDRAIKRVVVAGAGDAEWPECIRALREVATTA